MKDYFDRLKERMSSPSLEKQELKLEKLVNEIEKRKNDLDKTQVENTQKLYTATKELDQILQASEQEMTNLTQKMQEAKATYEQGIVEANHKIQTMEIAFKNLEVENRHLKQIDQIRQEKDSLRQEMLKCQELALMATKKQIEIELLSREKEYQHNQKVLESRKLIQSEREDVEKRKLSLVLEKMEKMEIIKNIKIEQEKVKVEKDKALNEVQARENKIFDQVQEYKRKIHETGIDNKALLERIRTISEHHQQEKSNMQQQMSNVKAEVHHQKIEMARKMKLASDYYQQAVNAYDEITNSAYKRVDAVWEEVYKSLTPKSERLPRDKRLNWVGYYFQKHSTGRELVHKIRKRLNIK